MTMRSACARVIVPDVPSSSSQASSNAAVVPTWLPPGTGFVSKSLKLDVSRPSRATPCEFYVVGTSHASAAAAVDVRRVIRRVKPQAVVLELDQERADALVARFVERARVIDDSEYGSDLLTGIIESEREEALTVYGDVRARGIGEALAARAFGTNPFAIARWKSVLAYVKNAWGGGAVKSSSECALAAADVPRALVNEPRNLTPLAGPAVAFVTATLASLAVPNSPANGLADAWSVFLALFLFCPLVETLWMDRDEVLCANALNAVDVCSGIARGRVRRVRFDFSTDSSTTAKSMQMFVPSNADAIPCFTLKRPLGCGELRRLNLWEPRWLALMDSLAEANGGSLVGAELGCLLGRARHYVSSSCFEIPADATRRTGTVAVEDSVRRARVTRVVEGERPTTKARKLEVWIEGLDEYDVRSLETHPAGYLLASVEASRVRRVNENDEEVVTCVIVTGLAHANGIIRGIAEA
jgi:hypothetical protein